MAYDMHPDCYFKWNIIQSPDIFSFEANKRFIKNYYGVLMGNIV